MQLQAYLGEIRRLRFFIIPVFLVILGTYFIYNWTDQETAFILGKEDGFYEWGTSVAYFAAFLFLMLTFKRTRNIFILLLSLVMFFGAFEEISWGQRLFGYKTPEKIKEINVQGEFTVHNLELFNPVKKNGERKTGLEEITDLNFLLKIFNLSFGILLPFCVFHIKIISVFCKKLRIPIPPISIGIFFLLSRIGMKYSIKYFTIDKTKFFEINYIVEIAEFNSAFILAMISLYFYIYSKRYSIEEDIKQFRVT